MQDDLTTPRFYVYVLSTPEPDSRPFYIGKGQGRRVFAHEAEAMRDCTCHKCRVIRKIWRLGGEVQRSIVFRTDDEDTAFEEEKRRIAEIGLANLCNVAEGGRMPASLEAMMLQKEDSTKYGNGSVYRRKDGRWGAALNMAHFGMPACRRFVYGRTQQEVEDKLAELRREKAELLNTSTMDIQAYDLTGILRGLKRHADRLDNATAIDLLEGLVWYRDQLREAREREAAAAALLRERVTTDEIVVYDESGDGGCFHCGAEWHMAAGLDLNELTVEHELHRDHCWVLRVRAYLEAAKS